jgi:uncharacterized protein (TIGR03067 family)
VKSVCLCTLVCVVALLVAGTAAPAPVPPPPRNTPELELARLSGRWQAVLWQVKGTNLFVDDDQYMRVIAFAEDGSFTWITGNSSNGKIARLDPTQKLKEIDYTFTTGGFKGMVQKGIYKLEGDTLTECFSDPGENRPTEFKSTHENRCGLIVYKRIKKDD